MVDLLCSRYFTLKAISNIDTAFQVERHLRSRKNIDLSLDINSQVQVLLNDSLKLGIQNLHIKNNTLIVVWSSSDFAKVMVDEQGHC